MRACLLLACLGSIALPGTALAATPATPPAPAPPAPGAPPLTLRLVGAQALAGRWLVLTGTRFSVRGTIAPFAAGESVTIAVYEHGREVSQAVPPVVAGIAVPGAPTPIGQFVASFRLARAGAVLIQAQLTPAPGQPATATANIRLEALAPQLAFGARGTLVALLQQRLARLHYEVPRSGVFDQGTADAVMAYRKVSRLPRDTTVDRGLLTRLLAGRGAFPVRYRRQGRHVEANLSLQVLALIDRGGRVSRIYTISSGKPSTPTVLGTFQFYSKTPGVNTKGMVDSNYFYRGYAVHGYPDVPDYPASHGCLRVPIPDAAGIFGWIQLGETIDVYY